MKKGYETIIVFSIILLYVLTLFFITTKQYDNFIFDSPNTNVIFLHTKHYLQNDTLAIDKNLPLSEKYEKYVFLRDGSSSNGKYLPKTFLGIFPFLAILFLVGESLFFLIPLLLYAIASLFAYKTVRLYQNKKNSIIFLSLFFFIIPILVLFSSELKTHTLALPFFSAAVYYFFKLRTGRSDLSQNRILFYLLAAISLFFRYDFLFYIFPLISYQVIMDLKVKDYKGIVFGLTIGIVVFLPILILNYQLYGFFYKTGYSITSQFLQEIFNFSDENFFIISIIGFDLIKFSKDVMFKNLVGYLFHSLFFWVPLGIIFILNVKVNKLIKIYVLYILIFSIIFYWGRISWGFEGFLFSASILRYSIIPFTFIFYFFLDSIKKFSKVSFFIVIFCFILITLLSISEPNTFFTNKLGENDIAKEFRQEVLDNLNNEDFLITKYRDKYIFPDRNIIIVAYLQDNESPIIKDRPLWEYPPNPIILEGIIDELFIAERNVYIDKETYNSNSVYYELFNSGDYFVQKISNNLYKIEILGGSNAN